MDASSSAQYVTHPNLHIKSAHDAHILFEAVRLGHLPIIRRRLNSAERAALRSGNVFVWEEAVYKGGLERWTDSRKWSASRMREPFLFYEEKVIRNPELKPPRRVQPSYDSDRPTKYPRHSHADLREPSPDGLTKQTYSAWVNLPTLDHHGRHTGVITRKKWHLTAYFSSTSFAHIPGVMDDALLRTIQVPRDMYETGKGLMRKSSNASSHVPSHSPYQDGYALRRASVTSSMADDDTSSSQTEDDYSISHSRGDAYRPPHYPSSYNNNPHYYPHSVDSSRSLSISPHAPNRLPPLHQISLPSPFPHERSHSTGGLASPPVSPLDNLHISSGTARPSYARSQSFNTNTLPPNYHQSYPSPPNDSRLRSLSGAASLPIPSSAGPRLGPGLSKEDQKALGAFKLQL